MRRLRGGGGFVSTCAWLNDVKACFQLGAVLYSKHARDEMLNEEFGEIAEQEVYEAVSNSHVIEEYPHDKPYESRLLMGMTGASRPLHVLCAYVPEDKTTIVITAYEPEPNRWIEFKRRKKQ